MALSRALFLGASPEYRSGLMMGYSHIMHIARSRIENAAFCLVSTRIIYYYAVVVMHALLTTFFLIRMVKRHSDWKEANMKCL